MRVPETCDNDGTAGTPRAIRRAQAARAAVATGGQRAELRLRLPDRLWLGLPALPAPTRPAEGADRHAAILAALPGLLALGFAPVATRLGRRRVFLVCWAARKFVIARLLLPWVLVRFGHTGGLIYVTAIIAVFAALRSLPKRRGIPGPRR